MGDGPTLLSPSNWPTNQLTNQPNPVTPPPRHRDVGEVSSITLRLEAVAGSSWKAGKEVWHLKKVPRAGRVGAVAGFGCSRFRL